MKKIVVLSLVTVFAISCCLFGVSLYKDKAQQNGKLSVSSSSQYYTDDQLVNSSDKIIKAKVTKVKDRFTKVVDATNSDGEKFDVKIPYVIYELEIISDADLDSANEDEKIELVLLDGEQNDKFLTIGEDNIFFLQKSPRQDIFKGAYIPISLEQGVYSTVNTDGQITSKLTKENIDYKQLINRIKEKKSSKE